MSPRVADKGFWDSIWVYRPLPHRPDAGADDTPSSAGPHRRAGPRHQAGQHRPDGRLQRLSQPRALRQDRVHRRCRQPQPPVRRHRRGLVRARVEGLRLRVDRHADRGWAAFREAVQIIHKMWTEDYPVFNGKHYSIDKPINEPKVPGKARSRFWIGGGGEQVTLKLVAQYGDACNIGGGNPEVIRQKLRGPQAATARRSAATTTRSSSPARSAST